MTALTVRQRCEADGFSLREICVQEGKSLCEQPCDWWNQNMKKLPWITRAQWISALLTLLVSLAAASIIGIFSLMWVHNIAFESLRGDVASLKGDVGMIKTALLQPRRVEVRGE